MKNTTGIVLAAVAALCAERVGERIGEKRLGDAKPPEVKLYIEMHDLDIRAGTNAMDVIHIGTVQEDGKI